MATSIKNFETISDFNQMLGVDTLHPLVSVICLDNSKPMTPADQLLDLPFLKAII